MGITGKNELVFSNLELGGGVRNKTKTICPLTLRGVRQKQTGKGSSTEGFYFFTPTKEQGQAPEGASSARGKNYTLAFQPQAGSPTKHSQSRADVCGYVPTTTEEPTKRKVVTAWP